MKKIFQLFKLFSKDQIETENTQKQFESERDKWQANKQRLLKIDQTNYDQDGLFTNHYHEFMREKPFKAAYQRGIQAVGIDYHWHWRVHVFLWAFEQAMKLDGACVECGVNKGFMTSAAFSYVNWNKLTKSAYLFDTFTGLDVTQLNNEEKQIGRDKQFAELYTDVYDDVKKNFSEFKRVHLIKGSVPSSLKSVKIPKVAFLALDMNNAYPEVEALKFFWPKLVKGAFVLMDDYCYNGYYPQKKALDKVAKTLKTSVLSLPTGQGLIVKQ